MVQERREGKNLRINISRKQAKLFPVVFVYSIGEEGDDKNP
jgi:hypothetical protein